MTMIPETYEEWEHCITVKCGVPLSASFVAERIAALEDMKDHHTRKYIEMWGDEQRQKTVMWFREAEKRLTA